MTRTQFRRMTVFALRMAHVSIGGKRWQNDVRSHVAEILYRLNDECFSCHWSHTIDWDHITRLPDDDGTCGFAWRDGRSLLCDFVSEYLWENNLEREKEDRHGNCELVKTKVGIAVSCCIRAACDVAAEPSAGVAGFTIGDLKTMWAPRPIPKWVSAAYEQDLNSLDSQESIWL